MNAQDQDLTDDSLISDDSYRQALRNFARAGNDEPVQAQAEKLSQLSQE